MKVQGWVRYGSYGALVLGGALALSSVQAVAQDQQQADKMFVRKASEGGYAEVQLGQLASQKAQNPDVKAFGEKMVHDHTMLDDKMKPVAEELGVTPADHMNAMDQAEYDKLSALSGSDFDRAYVEAMVKDHRKDLREFRHEEMTAANAELKQTVAQGEKVIAEHMRLANHLAREIGVQPASGSPAE